MTYPHTERQASRPLQTMRSGSTGFSPWTEELKQGTIETVLAKSDLELGLEFLLGNQKPHGTEFRAQQRNRLRLVGNETRGSESGSI